jgi:hypothetical protein
MIKTISGSAVAPEYSDDSACSDAASVSQFSRFRAESFPAFMAYDSKNVVFRVRIA